MKMIFLLEIWIKFCAVYLFRIFESRIFMFGLGVIEMLGKRFCFRIFFFKFRIPEILRQHSCVEWWICKQNIPLGSLLKHKTDSVLDFVWILFSFSGREICRKSQCQSVAILDFSGFIWSCLVYWEVM